MDLTEIIVLEMPSASPIEAEAYAEFGKALEVLQDTKAFSKKIAETVSEPGKLLVLLEGETDPIYLQTAVELLGQPELLESVEFAWVGQKGSMTGESFLTGKGGLNQTLAVLRVHPEIMKRPVLLLYDSDARKPVEDHHDLLHVRSMPVNGENSVAGGIENLLPARAVSEEWYAVTERKLLDGGKVVRTELRKMDLCMHLCSVKRDPADLRSLERSLL